MEVQVSNASTDFPATEGGSQVDCHEQLHEVIAEGSLDFDSWTSLISEVEKTYPDNTETICFAYDSFLSKFPLCHGYWRKYANHKIRLCTVDKVVEIFERAVQSATYSVGVWVDYCSFGMSVFEDPFDVRRLFKRGMSFVGKDYLCHTLWDKYIEFEFSQQQWNFLAHIYIQTFRFPTKNLHRYYDNFQKFAAILKEEMECHDDCINEEQSEAVPDVAVITPGDDICHAIKDLLDPSVGSLRSKALQKYISIGEQFYQKACCLDEKIHFFETCIRRPYFHVKPLDDNQLENWHHYLDFVEMQEDFDWAVKLYERCLIPCANFPEFWMRYVEFMETKGGREVANFALDRATQIFLKNVPAMHLFSARYKEQIGDVSGARAAFVQCNTKSNSHFIENVIKEANMEKRLGNSAAAFHVYEKALEMATERQNLHTVPSLYIHFSHLKYMITGSVDAAMDVIIDGIQHVPHCKLLLEGLINFAMMHGGPRQVNIVDSIIAHAISPGPDLSQGLGTKDREDISLLYLEFVDFCGTIHDIRKARNRHTKLFPHLIRNYFSFEEPTSGTQLFVLAMEGRKYNPFEKPDQSSGDHCSGHLIQLPVQDQQPMLPENHAIEPDHGFTEQFQIEDENNARGRLQSLSPKFAEESRKDASVDKPSNDLDFQSVDDASEPMESTHDLVDQSGKDICRPMESTHDLVLQSREDASGATETTHDLALQGADKIASLEAPEEYSDSVNVQQEQDHVKQHLKPFSLGGLSLNHQDKESVGLVPMASFEHDVPLETCVSEGILESCQNTNVNPSIACPRSSPAADSTQIQNDTDENESLSPSSSASNHNPRSTKAHPQPNVPANSGRNSPANSGRNSHQMNNMLEASEDADSRPHEDLQNQYHQQQLVSPQQQCSSAELDAQKLMNQGHSHHPSSWRNSQVAQGTQAQNQYQAGATQGSSTAIHAKPTQNVQQHSFVAVPQPHVSPQPVSQPQAQMSPCSLQSGEKLGHAQNSQAYNTASQYCYQQQQQMQQYLQPYQQQQQQQLQSQQQPDQQQLLLLQQQHYLQQQQHYQPQQMQQQQHLFYLQQHYQQFQQLQQQQSNQQWQQLLQQHQQQQNHQLQQWQQVQEGYQQMQQQQLLQQQQEYEQRLQQARLRPQEEYQKLQQLALQQSQQGYQQFVQQQQMQQEEEYEQRLQQARLQPQEEYQKLQQIAEQQLQQGYQQLQHQQQQEVQWQQQQEQLPHQQQQGEEQLQHQLQITSTQNLTWDRSSYQQGQRATPPHSRAASGSAESPHIHQESPNARSTGTSGPAVSPYHRLQSPHGIIPLHSAGPSGHAASPYPGQQSPHAQ